MGLVLLVLLIALAAGALPSGGFWWDFLAALGYCALALIAFMGWDSESPVRAPRLRLHRNLAILAAVVATVHALGYLVIDLTVLEYLMPAAPNYMLLGVLAWLLLIATTYSSLPAPRKRAYSDFGAFRSWHRALYLLLLGASAWHVFATEFSLTSIWQVAALLSLLIGAPLAAYMARRAGKAAPVTDAPAADRDADLHPVLCGVAMLVLSASFAGLKAAACATC
jgi:hypothetical protein